MAGTPETWPKTRRLLQLFVTGEASELEVPLTDSGPGIWTAQQFRLNTAHAKILALLLAYNQPIDLLTGQKIDVSRAIHYANIREYHHFFPRAYLDQAGVSKRKGNLLANIIMLTADSNKIISSDAPSEYLKRAEASLGDGLKTALESNLISDAAYAAAKADDYESFLAERAKTIYLRTKDLTGW